MNENISRVEALLKTILGSEFNLEAPRSRVEQILKDIIDEVDPVSITPKSRVETLLIGMADLIAHGGGVTVEPLSVSENGTKTAPAGKAYSPVSVNVPNSYAASDEGKVVSNGALVAQTAHAAITQNGTVDTTLNNSVEVNVPVDLNFTKIYEFDAVIPEQTSASQTISVPFPNKDQWKIKFYPMIIHFKCSTEPTAPELPTLVESWWLFTPHANALYYTCERGSWGRLVNTDGSQIYPTDAYSLANLASKLLVVNNILIDLSLKAARTDSLVMPGTWHCELYALSGYVGAIS